MEVLVDVKKDSLLAKFQVEGKVNVIKAMPKMEILPLRMEEVPQFVTQKVFHPRGYYIQEEHALEQTMILLQQVILCCTRWRNNPKWSQP